MSPESGSSCAVSAKPCSVRLRWQQVCSAVIEFARFEVDPILSVQFSNHTGYPTMKGTVMEGPELATIVDGLEENGLLQQSHLLTGYIGSVTFLKQVVQVHQKVKQHNPDLIYGASALAPQLQIDLGIQSSISSRPFQMLMIKPVGCTSWSSSTGKHCNEQCACFDAIVTRAAAAIDTTGQGKPVRIGAVCDPVLGDNGKLYVPEIWWELIEIMWCRWQTC